MSIFVNQTVFNMCISQPPDVTSIKSLDSSKTPPLSALVTKLMGCLHHLEQVKYEK